MKRRMLDLLRRGDAGLNAKQNRGIVLGLLFGLFLLAIPALAQTGGGYDLSWSTIDGGGGTFSTGGGYSVGGTIGQPDAGTHSGGGYAVTGGFWGAAITSATPAPTNTAAPTNTTGPTNTPGSHTPTRTATVGPPPTACPIQFADVLPDNTFYPHVRCLACRGIDTGYACGGPGEPCNPQNHPYFRINTLIKRDDLAHMVAASAGFNEDPGPRRFQDVTTSNPYYAWVQRMANRGLIGGYPCGGPGEPCVPPNNWAYYRPSANATRGQIAKIVSNGAGFSEPPVGQLFEDVPPIQPFYEWIQRLANRGVMGGYPCGGAGEPCVPPTNRPYFRWYNDATRGQVAKIVTNTFFPNCITPSGR